jgi:molybdate transport system substrate-binding protein
MRRYSIFCFFVVTCLVFPALAIGQPVPAGNVLRVAAAADLKFALTEIAQNYQRETGVKPKLSFGSSGNFTQQIEQGAPFDLFLCADENYIFRLADKGLTRDRGVLYGTGRIGVFVPNGSTLSADSELQDLRDALSNGRLRRFAIANPEHAPYGRAARAALKTAGLWDMVRPSLVLGENASQAMQFAASGSSQGGIVPLALSLVPEISALGQFALLPAEWHAAEPLRQRMALLREATAGAADFYLYLQQPAARKILEQYGFVLPTGAKQ